jgi:hypothetical protein
VRDTFFSSFSRFPQGWSEIDVKGLMLFYDAGNDSNLGIGQENLVLDDPPLFVRSMDYPEVDRFVPGCVPCKDLKKSLITCQPNSLLFLSGSTPSLISLPTPDPFRFH